MSQVQFEAFSLVQNACTAFPSTLVSMLELSPPLPILLLLRVAGLSGLNTIIVQAPAQGDELYLSIRRTILAVAKSNRTYKQSTQLAVCLTAGR
jgi:hypothetical protein